MTGREAAVGRGGAWSPLPLPAVETFASQFTEFHAACTADAPLSAPGEWGLEVVAVPDGRAVAVADVLRRAGVTSAPPAPSPGR